jgi:hypothetical protein
MAIRVYVRERGAQGGEAVRPDSARRRDLREMEIALVVVECRRTLDRREKDIGQPVLIHIA